MSQISLLIRRRRHRARALPILCSLFLLFCSLSAPNMRAQEPPPSPFKVRLDLDIPILISALFGASIPGMFFDEFSPPHCDPCDPSNVNGLDRTAIGFNSHRAGKIGDILLWTIPGASMLASLWHLPVFGWHGLLQDLLMIGQAAALAGATQQITGMAVRRPRPYMYVTGIRQEDRKKPIAAVSFFSGHTAVAYATTMSAAYIYGQRQPHSRYKWVVWLVAALLPLPLPFLRVASGDHFWTDVLAGAALGTTFGLVVPAMHARPTQQSPVRISLSPSRSGVALACQF